MLCLSRVAGLSVLSWCQSAFRFARQGLGTVVQASRVRIDAANTVFRSLHMSQAYLPSINPLPMKTCRNHPPACTNENKPYRARFIRMTGIVRIRSEPTRAREPNVSVTQTFLALQRAAKMRSLFSLGASQTRKKAQGSCDP